MEDKNSLRKKLRALRRKHVAALPESMMGLMFHRPPSPLTAIIPENSVVGLYSAGQEEAPTIGYARHFHENGHTLALPWFADRDSPMTFRQWHSPYDEDELQSGPFGVMQPADDSPEIVPHIAFVPLIGFTAQGSRLGQGGGHYDRWLAANPHCIAIGLGWDSQLVDAIPTEDHDHALHMVVTPTRAYEGNR